MDFSNFLCSVRANFFGFPEQCGMYQIKAFLCFINIKIVYHKFDRNRAKRKTVIVGRAQTLESSKFTIKS